MVMGVVRVACEYYVWYWQLVEPLKYHCDMLQEYHKEYSGYLCTTSTRPCYSSTIYPMRGFFKSQRWGSLSATINCTPDFWCCLNHRQFELTDEDQAWMKDQSKSPMGRSEYRLRITNWYSDPLGFGELRTQNSQNRNRFLHKAFCRDFFPEGSKSMRTSSSSWVSWLADFALPLSTHLGTWADT